MKRLAMCVVMLTTTSAGCIGGCGEGYSDGERTGVIWKLSKKGLTWKSWEGELNMGGNVLENGALVPNVFVFSVAKDDALAAKLSAEMAAGRRVTLRYRQWWASPWSQDSTYTIVGFEGAK